MPAKWRTQNTNASNKSPAPWRGSGRAYLVRILLARPATHFLHQIDSPFIACLDYNSHYAYRCERQHETNNTAFTDTLPASSDIATRLRLLICPGVCCITV